MPSSDAGPRRTCRTAPIMEPRACILRWAGAWRAACMANSLRSIVFRATETRDSPSIFAVCTRPRSTAGGACLRAGLLAAPLRRYRSCEPSEEYESARRPYRLVRHSRASGNPLAFDGCKMVPRFRRDDEKLAEAVTRRDLFQIVHLNVGVPGREELLPVRLSVRGDFFPRQRYFGRVLPGRQPPAQLLEPEIEQIGIHRVGLAVTADVVDPPLAIRSAHLAAIHAHFSRKPGKARHGVETGCCTRLIHRQHVHQIQMPSVIAAEIVVSLEFPVLVTPVPEFFRDHTVDERPLT